MKKKILALSITLIVANMPGALQAKGDPMSGKQKTGSCAGCHGEDGNSMMPSFPKLAEQHPEYLIKQLIAFKDGTRDSATMAPMVLAYGEDDFADMAAFYANQSISANSLPVLDDDDDDEDEDDDDDDDDDDEMEEASGPSVDELMALGSDLYRNGDLNNKISACIACHGPNGEGNKPAAFPALRSQHADYLIQSLQAYKAETRTNNADNMMRMIAKKMSEEQIKAVSYHISMMK